MPLNRSALVPILTIFVLTNLAAVGSSASDSTEWPTGQGDPARTGFRGDIHGPGTGEVIWRFEMRTLDVTPSPIMIDEVLYTGASDGYFYALNALNGTKIWELNIGRPIKAPAAFSEGIIVVAADEGNLHAISAQSGSLIWSTEDVRAWRASPTIHNGTIFIGTADGILISMDLFTGETRWKFDINNQGKPSSVTHSISGSPLLVDGQVIFGTGHWDIYSLNPENGAILWEIRMDGSLKNSISTDGERLFATTSGTLYALGLDGSILWEHSIRVGNDATPTVYDGIVYRAGRDDVFALDAEEGFVLWQNNETEGIVISIVVTDTTVYASTSKGIIIAIDATSGEVIWSNHIANHIRSSPIVVNGTLYIGSNQFRVFALDAGSGLDIIPDPNMRDPRASGPGFPFLIAFLMLGATIFLRRKRGKLSTPNHS